MHCTVSVDVNAPAEATWAAASDIENAAGRIPAITRLEVLPGPRSGVGMRWRETRVMFGREATETMEIAQWSPPRSYVATACSHGCEYRSTVSVTPTGAGCTLSIRFEGRPLTVVAKVMSVLMAPLAGRAVRNALIQDLQAIKRFTER